MDGQKGLTLTGQLGDVMKESAQIGLSYVRSHVTELGIKPGFEEKAIHVHVPAGALPEDGPAAGGTSGTGAGSPVRRPRGEKERGPACDGNGQRARVAVARAERN